MKSDEQSNIQKNNGNSHYINQLYCEALKDYNKALSLADSDEQKALIYGNRSAVYFKVKQYKECVENIQLAVEYCYPQEKLAKLQERENECEKLMKTEQPKKDPVADFLQLSYKANPKIPYIIEGIEQRRSEKFGIHLITTRDLKTGDIIAIEEPFLKSVQAGYEHERCAYCLNHNFFNLIPCDRCSDGKLRNLSHR
jgi:SET and MYND domain-containing protein 4